MWATKMTSLIPPLHSKATLTNRQLSQGQRRQEYEDIGWVTNTAMEQGKKKGKGEQKNAMQVLPVYFSLRDWTQLMEGEVVSD